MNGTKTRTAVATALLVGALGLPAGAGAQELVLSLDSLVLSVLSVDVDTESSKFNEYRDIDSGFEIPELVIRGESDTGRYFLFAAENAKRRDAQYDLGYGVWGEYGLSVNYNKIPHRFGNDAKLLWSRTGPGRYEISDATQAALQNDFTANQRLLNADYIRNALQPYLDASQTIDIGLQRDRTTAAFDLGGLAGFSWKLGYEQENREGTRAWGGSFGFGNVNELPEPIDYKTTAAELKGEWVMKTTAVQVGYRYSKFENEISTLIWDNPFRITDSTDPNAYQAPGSRSVNGAVLGFADLAPDNESSLLFANARTRFAGTWWAQGSLSYNTMTQDDDLLPYTLNSAIVGLGFDGEEFDPTNPGNLPVSSPDLEVDVLSFTADLGGRFADKFALKLKARYYDYDNGSPRIELPGYVRFHVVWEEIPRITVPYSYTKQTLGAELDWEVTESQNLGFYYDLNSWDREFRETEQTDEDVFGVNWDARFGPRVSVRASYEIGDRTIDGEYETEAQEASFLHPEGINNQPGLRKFLQAAREYDEYRLRAQWFPIDTVDVAVFVNGRDEEYTESAFGLIDNEMTTYGFEVGYNPGAGLNVYLFGQLEDRTVFQRARQSGGSLSTNPADDWEATFDETTDTWGLGLSRMGVDKWSFDLSARWSNADGDAGFFSPPGGTPDAAFGFDDYDDVELLAFDAKGEYAITDNVSAGLSYLYEDYTIDRFLFENLERYEAGAILLLPNDGDYTANVFGLYLKLNL